MNDHKLEVDRNGTAIPRSTQINAGGLNGKRIQRDKKIWKKSELNTLKNQKIQQEIKMNR